MKKYMTEENIVNLQSCVYMQFVLFK